MWIVDLEMISVTSSRFVFSIYSSHRWTWLVIEYSTVVKFLDDFESPVTHCEVSFFRKLMQWIATWPCVADGHQGVDIRYQERCAQLCVPWLYEQGLSQCDFGRC